MSKMYGKRRVVLSKPYRYGEKAIVAVCGCDEPSVTCPGKHAGNYNPMGCWYQENGLFYVDLKSEEQKYQSVKFGELGHKHRGGFKTKKELRDFVMAVDNLEWHVYQLSIAGKPVDEPAGLLNKMLGGNYVVPKYRSYAANVPNGVRQ